MNSEVLTVAVKEDKLPVVDIPAPPPPTKKQIGQWRRQYVTRVYPEVVACGHKFNPDKPPVSKCSPCWEAYFKNSADLELLQKTLAEDGVKSMRRTYGDTYTKMFSRFIQQQLTKFQEERANGIHKETEGRTEGEGGNSSPSVGDGQIQNSVFSGEATGQGSQDDQQSSEIGQLSGSGDSSRTDQPTLG